MRDAAAAVTAATAAEMEAEQSCEKKLPAAEKVQSMPVIPLPGSVTAVPLLLLLTTTTTTTIITPTVTYSQ